MAKGTVYRQCKFHQMGEHCVREQVSWIPEKYATEGKTLRFKDDNNTWNDGWKVMEVYPQRRVDPTDPRNMIKSLRKATGDSLPRRT